MCVVCTELNFQWQTNKWKINKCTKFFFVFISELPDALLHFYLMEFQYFSFSSFFGKAFYLFFFSLASLFYFLFHFIDQHFKCCLHLASCFHSYPSRKLFILRNKACDCNKVIFGKYNVTSLGINCLNIIFR